MPQPWTLSDIRRLKESIEITHRLAAVEREHRLRQQLGDDVYEALRHGETPT